jgi:two-component system nitrogen regulation response regulator NtrX
MTEKNILIIDDDIDLLRSLQIILEDRSFVVHTASNKKEGLDILASVKPNLLIQDLMMDTNLEGFSIINELRNNIYFANMPIIMLTGIAEKMKVNFRSAVEDSEQYPNVTFLEKPVDPDVLISEINSLLS